MFQRGRCESQIKYKAEVLKVHPEAKYERSKHDINGSSSWGAIYLHGKRVSEVYRSAEQCWSSAYYRLEVDKHCT